MSEPHPTETQRDQAPISLDDFDFSKVIWKETDRTDPSGRRILAEADFEIVINDIVYTCKLNVSELVGQRIIRFYITIDQTSEERLIRGVIAFDVPNERGSTKVTTSIQRLKKNEKAKAIPTGTGIVFYKKMLDYIQSEAAKYKNGLVHVVSHDSAMGLTSEKWRRTFEPVLVERRYTRDVGGEWHREYQTKSD